VAGPEEIVIVGDEITVERQVQRYADAGATELMVSPFGLKEDQARTLELVSSFARANTGSDGQDG